MRHFDRLCAPALLTLFALVFSVSAAEPVMDLATLKLIPKRMSEFVDRHEISGVVTLVARNGQIAALDAV